MTLRTLGMISALAALAVGGWLYATQMRAAGPTSEAGRQVQSQASAATAGTNFQAAAPALASYFAEHGTYAGATLPPGYGVVLARADASSYCLQATVGGAVQHLVGPGGRPAPGSC